MKRLYSLLFAAAISAGAAQPQTLDSDGARLVDLYSRAECMLYQANPMPVMQKPNDTLTRLFFLNHHSGIPSNTVGLSTTQPPFSTWEIHNSASHVDVVALSGNQFPTGWRDRATMPFNIAITMQVAATNIFDTECVVEVYAIQNHKTAGGWRADTAIYGVSWSVFRQSNTDTVLFSDWFHFRYDFVPGIDSLLIELHTRRIITIRVGAICVEDSLARNLLACLYLASHSFAMAEITENVDRAIMDEVYMDENAGETCDEICLNMNGDFFPSRVPSSEWASYGRTAYIVRHCATQPRNPFVLRPDCDTVDRVSPTPPIAVTVERMPYIPPSFIEHEPPQTRTISRRKNRPSADLEKSL